MPITDRGAGLAGGVGSPATGMWTKGLVGQRAGNFGQSGGYEGAECATSRLGVGKHRKTRVLGWDAAGVVVSKGSAVRGFDVGDEMFYAGELDRPGSNAEYQAVDERLVGRKPKSIGFSEAAALPLTGITAWELLFDRFGVREGESGASLLV